MVIRRSLVTVLLERAKTHTVSVSIGAMVCLIWGIVIVDRINDREQIIANARKATTNFALAFEGHIRQTISTIDQILVAIRFERTSVHWKDLARTMAQTSGLDQAIFNITLFDRDGNLIASTATGANQIVNITDRPWYIQFQTTARDTLFVGQPVTNRTTGHLSAIFARGIWTEQGEFAGMVGISLNPEYIGAFYRRVPMGPHGVINLMGKDGTLTIHQFQAIGY